jgi:DNA-directed RNA polymerase subunit L/DNA-directed RNA polymerase alpha subunit
MFVELKKINSQRIQFTIKDIDLSIINAVRRIILSELPNIAFYFDSYDVDNNDIKVHSNTGVLHNEFISHRISLIPLHFDENELFNFNPINYKFSLKVKNSTSTVLPITSKNIEIADNDDKKYDNKFREKIFPKNRITGDHILITKLKPNLYDPVNGEEIDITAMGSINIAKKHSRWCPTSQCCYYNKIDDEHANEIFQEKIKNKGFSKKEIEDMRTKFDSLDIYRYFKKNKYDEPNEFIFLIESECGLRPTYLFFKGLLILNEKLELFIENLKTNNESVDITQMGNVDNFYQIGIKNEDHTLLNTLQCMIYKQNFQKSTTVSKKIEYIGYFQPHPLDNLMYIKIKFNADLKTDKEFTKTFMIEEVQKSITDIHIIIKDWIKFSKLDSSDIIEVQNYIKS